MQDATKYNSTSNPINLLTSHVPGTVHLNGSAHREHKEEGVFLSVLLLEGAVDPQHVGWKLVDIKPPLRSRHHRTQTGTVQTLGADAHAGDPPLGFARLVRICWGCGGHLEWLGRMAQTRRTIKYPMILPPLDKQCVLLSTSTGILTSSNWRLTIDDCIFVQQFYGPIPAFGELVLRVRFIRLIWQQQIARCFCVAAHTKFRVESELCVLWRIAARVH